MSTADGQDVLEVSRGGKYVLYDVYTPRPDDEKLDAENQGMPEGRMREPGQLVDLATFDDTIYDGSGFREAVIISVEYGRRK